MLLMLFKEVDMITVLTEDDVSILQNCGNPFDCKSDAYALLYTFYKEDNSRVGRLFEVPPSMNYSDVFPVHAIKMLEDFGIRSSYASFARAKADRTLIIIPEKALSSVVALEKFIVEWEDRYAPCTDCILEMSHERQEEWRKEMLTNGRADELSGILALLAAYSGFNSYLMEDRESRKRESGTQGYKNLLANGKPIFDLVYVDDLFSRYNCFTQYYDFNVNNINRVVEGLRAMAKPNTLFYLNALDNLDATVVMEKTHAGSVDELDSMWCRIAAYCTMRYGMKFAMPDGDDRVFLQYCKDMHSRFYCHCTDYLRILQRLPDITVHSGASFMSYAVLDRKLLQEYPDRYRLLVSYKYFPLEGEQWRIEEALSPLDKLDLVDVNSYFHMDVSDVRSALSSLYRLRELCDRFNLVCPERTFDCENIFIFREGGKDYLALLDSVTGALPFHLIPVIPGYPEIKVVLSAGELTELCDVRVLACTYWNNRMFCKALGRTLKTSELYWYYPKSSVGILYVNSRVLPGVANNLEGIDFDTVGLWNSISSQLRGDLIENPLLKVFPLKGLKREFLTYYGGPHPCGDTTLNVQESLWR